MTNIQWHAQKNTKAFDSLRHDEINKKLTQLKVDGKKQKKKGICAWKRQRQYVWMGGITSFQIIKQNMR